MMRVLFLLHYAGKQRYFPASATSTFTPLPSMRLSSTPDIPPAGTYRPDRTCVPVVHRVIDLVHNDHAGTDMLPQYQKTIDESVRSTRSSDGNHDHGKIQIGSDNMFVVGKIHTAPHHVIASFMQFHYRADLFFAFLRDEIDTVTDSYRIRAAPTFDPQIAFGHALV